MRTLRSLLLATLIVALATAAGTGADWPRWRGPEQNGLSKETGFLKSWPKEGPKLLWTFDKAGTGYSSFAVVGGTVYTMGARDKDEYAIAIADGKEVWATKIGPVWDFKSNRWSRGPNATPCVDGEMVYNLSSGGVLLAVDRKTGKEAWKVDVRKDLKGDIVPGSGGPDNIGWGYCWAPFVDGDKLITTPGGEGGLFAALDKTTGKILWRSKDVTDPATYSSPVMATIGGVKQYVYIVQSGVVGVSAEDGTLLWRHKRMDFPDIVGPAPVVVGDSVYVGIGAGGEGELLNVTGDGKKFAVKSAWQEKEIGTFLGGVVIIDGHAYGYHEDRAWMCQDVKDGKVKWQSKGRALKAGSLTGADGRLLFVLDETGQAGLLEATTKAYTEKGRFKLPKESTLRKPNGKVWTYPVVSDGKLYLRDQELVFCYEVK